MSTPDPEEVYRELRRKALKVTPEDIGLNLNAGTAYGVIMESGYTHGVATLVCLADGTASLYFSSGGGIVGGGQHDAVRLAVQQLVVSAQSHVADMQSTEFLPQPPPGMVRFYVLTKGDLLTDQAADTALQKGDSPLSPLFFEGHKVITALRRIAEQRPGG